MSEIISSWLKKDTPEQPLPTWRILCDAIAKVDSTAAKKIATDKGFDFVPSTGNNYICVCTSKINYNYSVALFLRNTTELAARIWTLFFYTMY